MMLFDVQRHRLSALATTSQAISKTLAASDSPDFRGESSTDAGVLAQPCAILQDDEGAKPSQTRIVWRSRLQIAQNFPQGAARHRPVVRALLQQDLRVADRPAHDLINDAVHRGARCLSVRDHNLKRTWQTRRRLRHGAKVPIWRRARAIARRRANGARQFGIAAQSRRRAIREPRVRLRQGRAGYSQAAG